MARRQIPIRTAVAAIALMAFIGRPAGAQDALPAPAGVDVASLEQGIATAPVMIDGAMVLRVERRLSVPGGRQRHWR